MLPSFIRWQRSLLRLGKDGTYTRGPAAALSLSRHEVKLDQPILVDPNVGPNSPEQQAVQIQALPAGDPIEVVEQTEIKAERIQPQPDLGTNTVFHGVTIPTRPKPPESDECCMSGCARCVYDLYTEDLQDFHKDMQHARSAVLALLRKASSVRTANSTFEWPVELLGPLPAAAEPSGSADDAARDKAGAEVDAEIDGLEPSMKAFLQMERRLRKKAEQGKGA